MKARPLLLAAIFLLVTLGCGLATPASMQQATSTNPQPATNAPKFGIAGLIPRNFPNSSAADWINLYETLPETGEMLGVYTAWADSPETAGQVPAVVSTVFELAPRYHFTPLVALSFFREDPDGGLEPLFSLADSGERAKFQQAAVEIARQYSPQYLALGVEVNS